MKLRQALPFDGAGGHGRIHIGLTGCGRTQTNTRNMLYDTCSTVFAPILHNHLHPQPSSARESPQLPNNGPTGSQTSATTPPHGHTEPSGGASTHAVTRRLPSRASSLPFTLPRVYSGRLADGSGTAAQLARRLLASTPGLRLWARAPGVQEGSAPTILTTRQSKQL
jgi:hypothetical protein